MFGTLPPQNDPKGWALWIPLAEFWYNTNYHTVIHMIPFEALYGYKPHLLNFGPSLQSSVQGVDDLIQEKQLIIQKVKQLLNQAKERMIATASKNRTEREFMVGDWVYLKLLPYRQLSIHRSHI